ncbi:MAG: hypothetical protein AAF607_15810 [Pseudomonadota bacterium]
MSIHAFFDVLIALHIISGAPGLLTFWIPVIAKKGGVLHSLWGKIFSYAMLFTGCAACAMALTTLYAPMPTHPQLIDHPEFSDPALVRGIFGWMMLYLAVLTINLTWYGWRCILNKRNHAANRHWFNMALQALLAIVSINCAIQGLIIKQVMMIGIAFVGFATVATNLIFILKTKPGRMDWLLEHIKGIVGTGISVYTAFFAFGAVRYIPELALAPALWAVPLIVGLSLIIYHQHKVKRAMRPARPTRRSIGAHFKTSELP